MIAIDGKYVDPLDSSNTDSQHYLGILEKIKAKYRKWPIHLVTPKELLIYNELNPAKPIYPGGHIIPMSASLPSPTGTREFRYYESTPGGEYMPPEFTFQKAFSIPKNKPDLAYFLLWCCPYCKNSMNPEVVNNGIRKAFMVDDPAEASREELRKLMYPTQAKDLILLHAKEKTIRETAHSYQIPGVLTIDLTDKLAEKIPHDAQGNITAHYDGEVVYDKTIDEVRLLLWNYIEMCAKTGDKIYKDVVERLTIENVYVNSRDMLDELLKNKIIKCEMEIRKPSNKPYGVWRYVDEIDPETNKKRSAIHICGEEQKTIEQCNDHFVYALDTKTILRERMKRALDRAGVVMG